MPSHTSDSASSQAATASPSPFAAVTNSSDDNDDDDESRTLRRRHPRLYHPQHHHKLTTMFFHPRRSYDAQSSPPIHSLPVELLSYVFLLSSHNSDNDMDDTLPQFTTESIKVPVVLSSVDRHWRSVARNTPALWTNICVTPEMIVFSDPAEEDEDAAGSGSCCSRRKQGVLDTHHLTSFLALSRHFPLNILIDARDQDWDFSEPEISPEYGFDTYTAPFSPTHMGAAISLLLPHLSRWRSLSILTDAWAPMYVALQFMNPFITTFGAPMLESLTLMRCNDFVSYASEFQPSAMRDPAFLSATTSSSSLLSSLSSSPSSETPPRPENILPKLNNLTLRGVHVDWTSLADILSSAAASAGGLRTLELASHCLDVRPSLSEFYQILSASPNLAKLIVSGSGPVLYDEEDDAVFGLLAQSPPHPTSTSSISSASSPSPSVPHTTSTPQTTPAPSSEWDLEEDPAPIHLPFLRDISIGYRTTHEGQQLLQLLEAPNVRTLELEDATHPSDPEVIDAGELLSFVGTGGIPTPSPSPSPAASPLLGAARRARTTRGVFPKLERVVLKGVKASARDLEVFFGGLRGLKGVEMVGMGVGCVKGLLPPAPVALSCGTPLASPSSSRSPVVRDALSFEEEEEQELPCPLLQTLSMKRVEKVQDVELEALVVGLRERVARGVCGLREVDVRTVDDCVGFSGGGGVLIGEGGMKLDVVGERGVVEGKVVISRDLTGGEGEEEEGETEDEQWCEGGAFNDAFFDAYYGWRVGVDVGA